MVIVLFGLPGAGKSYLGKLLEKAYGFTFLEGDNALTDDMKECVKNKESFTQEMRDKFTQILIDRISLVKKVTNNAPVVLSQALFKRKNREEIQEAFPGCFFVHVTSSADILFSRLLKRGDDVTPGYAEKIMPYLELPDDDALNTFTVNNDEEGGEACVKEINRYISLKDWAPSSQLSAPSSELDFFLEGKKVVITIELNECAPVNHGNLENQVMHLVASFAERGASIVLVTPIFLDIEAPEKVADFVLVKRVENIDGIVMREIEDASIFVGFALASGNLLTAVSAYAEEMKHSIMIAGFLLEHHFSLEQALSKLSTDNIDIIFVKTEADSDDCVTVLKKNNQLLKLYFEESSLLSKKVADIISTDTFHLMTQPGTPYEDIHYIETMISHRRRAKEISQKYMSDSFLTEAFHFAYQDLEVKTVIGNAYFRVRLYKSSQGIDLPTILYLPGTGFTRMIHDVEYALGEHLAKNVGCNVAVVNYRLAPENKFPDAVLDVYAALSYLVENAEKLEISQTHFITVGYSSGATLAIQLASATYGSRYSIDHQVLISPQTDFTFQHSGYKENEVNDRFVKHSFLKAIYQYYFTNPQQLSSNLFSPYYADDFNFFPSTQIMVGENDALRSDVEAFCGKLLALEIEFEKIVLKGMDHCSFWDNSALIFLLSECINEKFNIKISFEADLTSDFFEPKKTASIDSGRKDEIEEEMQYENKERKKVTPFNN